MQSMKKSEKLKNEFGETFRVASLVSLKPNTSNLVIFESVWFRIFGLVLVLFLFFFALFGFIFFCLVLFQISGSFAWDIQKLVSRRKKSRKCYFSAIFTQKCVWIFLVLFWRRLAFSWENCLATLETFVMLFCKFCCI